MAINIKRLKLDGVKVYPATILDAIKDSKQTITVNSEEVANGDYKKTLRTILDELKASVVSAEANAKSALVGDATTSGDTLGELEDRIESLETLLSSDADADDVINRISEVITWFNGVAETETGAALLADVAANKAAVGEPAKEAEYYATYAEYQADYEAHNWGVNLTKEDFNDLPANDSEKVKIGTGTDATGLYKAIEEAKAAVTHSKTTVVVGDNNGEIKVDGSTVVVYTPAANTVVDADYVHTDKNYTEADQTKLAGIEEGAEKNAENTVVDAEYKHITVTSTSVSDGTTTFTCSLTAEAVTDTTDYEDVF